MVAGVPPETSPNADSQPSGNDAFLDYYRTEIKPALAKSQARQAWRIRLIWLSAGAGLAWFLLINSELHHLTRLTSLSPDLFRLVGLAGAAAGLVQAYRLYRRIDPVAKTVAMEKICAFLGLTYNLFPSRSPLERFHERHLLSSFFPRGVHDEIAGERNGLRFSLVEAVSPHRAKDQNDPLAYSLLISCMVEKPFPGRTIVTIDEGPLGNFLERHVMPGDRIALEDPRFEHVFEVYGTDQIECRHLLTPSLMERILEISRGAGHGQLRVAFEGHEASIVVSREDAYFEPGAALTSVYNVEWIQPMLDDVSMALWVVDRFTAALQEWR